MVQPLALLLYDRVLPGGQLVNRLQDLGYRVVTAADPASLKEQAEHEKPLLVIVDAESRPEPVCEAIRQLSQHGPTAHLPVIAITAEGNTRLQEAARGAGATIVVTDHAILVHLSQLLQQALHLE